MANATIANREALLDNEAAEREALLDNEAAEREVLLDNEAAEREVLLDNEVAEREVREAAEDLERIEEDAKREADAYVEVKDLDGDEKASVGAAGSAFDFSQAELDTAMVAGQVEEDLAWGNDVPGHKDASEDW